MKKEIVVCDHCGGIDSLCKTADGKDLCVHCLDIENRKNKFPVGSRVRYSISKIIRDHGNQYTEETEKTGKMIRIRAIKTFGAECLVEHDAGERTWVYIGEIESAD